MCGSDGFLLRRIVRELHGRPCDDLVVSTSHKCYTRDDGMCYASGMSRHRICVVCRSEFEGRADAVTCSTRCRVARHRAAARFAPGRMRDADRWVRHVAKRPIRPDGAAASSTDAATWSSFDDVMRSDRGHGVGFVLNGDGVMCVDLDGCVEDGRPSEWAERILALFPGAAVEVSLSGRGLHIWGMGPNVSQVFGHDGGKVEVYADKRYIAMTGNWLRRGDLVDLSDGLSELGVL